MNEFVRPIAEWCAAGVELLGLAVIILFATVSLIMGVVLFIKGHAKEDIFSNVRQVLGQGILLGLEFLIAADIIHTVAVELTFESIGVLALVVLIPTSLRFPLVLERTGRCPCQHPPPRTRPRHLCPVSVTPHHYPDHRPRECTQSDALTAGIRPHQLNIYTANSSLREAEVFIEQ